MFEKKGIIAIDSKEIKEDEVLNNIIDLDIEEFIHENDIYIIETKPEKVNQISQAIRNFGYNLKSKNIQLVPKTLHNVNKKELFSAKELLNDLEENDDVTNLFTNLNVNIH